MRFHADGLILQRENRNSPGFIDADLAARDYAFVLLIAPMMQTSPIPKDLASSALLRGSEWMRSVSTAVTRPRSFLDAELLHSLFVVALRSCA
jgi:hypothetical protein